MAVLKTEQIGVRVTPRQKRDLEQRAEAAGYRLAEWVRQAALEKASREARADRPESGIAA